MHLFVDVCDACVLCAQSAFCFLVRLVRLCMKLEADFPLEENTYWGNTHYLFTTEPERGLQHSTPMSVVACRSGVDHAPGLTQCCMIHSAPDTWLITESCATS